MRLVILLALASTLSVAGVSAADKPPRDPRAADMREMREALATLSAVIEAASRPPGRVDEAPWLLQESLRHGVVDPAGMGALIRWVLYEKEEKVAAAVADALHAVEPNLAGLNGHRYEAAARSVIAAFQGVLRDAEHNRRRDGDAVLRELTPAIDAAAEALRDVQEQLRQPPRDDPPADEPEKHGPEQ